MSLTIRKALPADAEALVAVELSAGRSFLGTAFAWIADDAHPPELHRDFAGRGLEWVAVAEGEPVGFLCAEPDGDDFYLAELSVRHDRQRQGIGRALIEAVAEHARAGGFGGLTLTTFRDIPFNAPAYRRLGFADHRDSPRLNAKIAREEASFGAGTRVAMRRPLG